MDLPSFSETARAILVDQLTTKRSFEVSPSLAVTLAGLGAGGILGSKAYGAIAPLDGFNQLPKKAIELSPELIRTIAGAGAGGIAGGLMPAPDKKRRLLQAMAGAGAGGLLGHQAPNIADKFNGLMGPEKLLASPPPSAGGMSSIGADVQQAMNIPKPPAVNVLPPGA